MVGRQRRPARRDARCGAPPLGRHAGPERRQPPQRRLGPAAPGAQLDRLRRRGMAQVQREARRRPAPVRFERHRADHAVAATGGGPRPGRAARACGPSRPARPPHPTAEGGACPVSACSAHRAEHEDVARGVGQLAGDHLGAGVGQRGVHRLESPINRATPRSPSSGSPSSVNRMFAGVTSPCTTSGGVHVRQRGRRRGHRRHDLARRQPSARGKQLVQAAAAGEVEYEHDRVVVALDTAQPDQVRVVERARAPPPRPRRRGVARDRSAGSASAPPRRRSSAASRARPRRTRRRRSAPRPGIPPTATCHPCPDARSGRAADPGCPQDGSDRSPCSVARGGRRQLGRPPDLLADVAAERGHQHRPHEEGVEDDAERDREPDLARNTSGTMPSTTNVAASTSPAEVITPPVTARPRVMPSRVPCSSVSSRTRVIRKML